MDKCWRIAAKGNMLKIGDATKSMDLAPWIFMTQDVINKLPKDIEGKIVTYTTELQQGQKFINSITVVGASNPIVATPKSTVSTGAITPAGKEVHATTQKDAFLPKEEWVAKMKAEGKWNEHTDGGKSPEVQSSIKRQAIGNMTSRTLIGLQGILTPDNVEELMEKVYKKYVELVG